MSGLMECGVETLTRLFPQEEATLHALCDGPKNPDISLEEPENELWELLRDDIKHVCFPFRRCCTLSSAAPPWF
jgi:hypothetical protein